MNLSRVPSSEHEAYETLEGSASAAALITCEHASDRFFAPWTLGHDQRRLEGTHWTYDPGAEAIARGLAHALDAPAVLARFSRLIIDPNRELAAPTLFRDVADGLPIALNRDVNDIDRAIRVSRFYEPYHAAVDAALGACAAPLVFPVHTFTDEYEGSRRSMELGVLFDAETELAEALHAALVASRFTAELNEPWSGKDGLIYSGERHALAHKRRVLELEVRQDCAVDPAFRERLVPVVAEALRGFAGQLRAAE